MTLRAAYLITGFLLVVFPSSLGQDAPVSDIKLRADKTPPYIAGESVKFYCDAIDGEPPPLLRWTVNGARVKNSQERLNQRKSFVQGTLEVKIYKEMDQKKLICEASNGISPSQTRDISLSVKYPPDVSVQFNQDTNVVICTANGNPKKLVSSRWSYTLGNKTQPVNENGITANLQLKLGAPRFEETGYYTCTVSNGIGEEQSGRIFVQPRTKPRFTNPVTNYTVVVEENVTVTFDVYSSPRVSTYEWIKDDVVWSPVDWGADDQIEDINMTVLVREYPLAVKGQTITLHMSNVSLNLDGNYTLRVSNTKGDISQIGFILNVFKPEKITVGPVIREGGLGAGFIVLIVVVVINVIVCLGIIYWRSRRMSQRQAKLKIHGRSKESSKFLPESSVPPTPPKRTTSAGRVRPASKEKTRCGHYAELDFGHINNGGDSNSIIRREPPTEYAWIDFSKSAPTLAVASPGAW